MKYVSFEQAFEAQIGGHFYHFNVGSYNLEDELADLVVTNYGDRGASFGIMPSEGGAEPLTQEEAEAPLEDEVVPEPVPDSALGRDATAAEVATADAADDAAEERAQDRADAPSRRGKRTK